MRISFITNVFVALAISNFTCALELDGTKSYYGNVTAVISGFWNNVGVQLDSGVMCNGRSVVMLHSDNPSFDQSYAILLAVKASNQKVHLGPKIGPEHVDAVSDMCLIDEVSMGEVRSWASY